MLAECQVLELTMVFRHYDHRALALTFSGMEVYCGNSIMMWRKAGMGEIMHVRMSK